MKVQYSASMKTYLSVSGIAEKLQCSLSTAKRWVKDQKLTVFQVGRLARYDNDEIEAALKKSTKPVPRPRKADKPVKPPTSLGSSPNLI